jgi:hypothetical protein
MLPDWRPPVDRVGSASPATPPSPWGLPVSASERIYAHYAVASAHPARWLHRLVSPHESPKAALQRGVAA